MKTTRRKFIKGLLVAGVAVTIPLPSFERNQPLEDVRAEIKRIEVEDIHVNRTLTDLSVSYLQESDGFISGKVFPLATNKSGYFFTNCVA